MDKLECKECGREGIKKGVDIEFCCDCEDFFCYNTGCNWLNSRDGLYICEECLPEETEAEFEIDCSLKKIKINEEKFLFPGQVFSKSADILNKEGFKEKYILDRGDEKIIKYGKDCGLGFEVRENKIKTINIWSGSHRTTKGISIYSSKEEVKENYGNDFKAEVIDDYNSTYEYPNIKFFFTRVGPKREIVMKILVF